VTARPQIAPAERTVGGRITRSARRVEPDPVPSRHRLNAVNTVAEATENHRSVRTIRLCEARERAEQEDVVRAVAPAIRIEERISEERTPDRNQSGLHVHGRRECSIDELQLPSWIRKDQVEQQGEGEPRSDHPEAPDERWTVRPPFPDGCETDEPRQDREVAYRAHRTKSGRDQPAHDQRESGEDREGGSGAGTPGVGREPARSQATASAPRA
jgi:hypothetical protein